MGWVHRYRKTWTRARSWYTRGMGAFEEVGDLDRAGVARLALANIVMRSGRLEEAHALAEEVRDSGTGDTPIRRKVVYAASLIHLGEMAYERKDYQGAQELARRSQGVIA